MLLTKNATSLRRSTGGSCYEVARGKSPSGYRRSLKRFGDDFAIFLSAVRQRLALFKNVAVLARSNGHGNGWQGDLVGGRGIRIRWRICAGLRCRIAVLGRRGDVVY